MWLLTIVAFSVPLLYDTSKLEIPGLQEDQIDTKRSYEQALEKWQKHLSELENPYLVKDIIQKLQEI